MKVLLFADIFAKPGRRAVACAINDLIAEYDPDFVLGNVENLAGGRGINRKSIQEMFNLGFHGFSSGNHIWDNKEGHEIVNTDQRIVRPANYPNHPDFPCPGRGWTILDNRGKRLALVNLMGRVFMDTIDCPFAKADEILKQCPAGVPILVDMHADATSEKYAMGWHLNGRVSAVVGSHSHVQTADERILPGGTAYITDVGMTGAFDSVIGLSPEGAIKRFQIRRPVRVELATENLGVSCVVIDIGPDCKAKSIQRLRFQVDTRERFIGDLE